MRPSFWIIVLPLVTQTFSKEDSSWPSTVCSADFYIKEGKCTPCSDGFFGPNCSISCPFPSYGRRCLDGECNCSKEICDPRNGCVYERHNKEIQKYNTYEVYTVRERNRTTTVAGFELNIQKSINVQDSSNNDDQSTVLIVVAVIGAFIIIALVTVLVVQFKGKQFIRKHTVFFKRDAELTSPRHVDTYCEIDDSKVTEIDCKILRESELEVYESIDQSRKDGTNYTALPARQRDSTNQLTTVSMNIILADDHGADEDINEKDEPGTNVQIRKKSVNHDQPSHKRIGKTSTKISGYIDMTNKKQGDYVSMTAENLEQKKEASN
uniref:Uncharacterized protein LOC111102740 n=1 Tax=Crassostrea virginica TaxID=6565 RepID=A0A8B8AJB4_CRAVI|nr:uncharacterized protein LOC111102740 [Crassostrea virginica]